MTSGYTTGMRYIKCTLTALVVATIAAIGVAPSAQAATYTDVGVVGGYHTFYNSGTCSSGGHDCDAVQVAGSSSCSSGLRARLGKYDDVRVSFYATSDWGCAQSTQQAVQAIA